MSIVFAFIFQYAVAPRIVDFTFSNYVVDAWRDGCENLGSEDLTNRCAGNSAVYRAALSATLFFVLAAIAVACKPTANREAWPAKYVLFCFLTLAFCFVPNDPLFDPIYLNIARVGSIFFILFEQIILIDMAYNWNDGWVEKSNVAEAEKEGSGKKWLGAILFSCTLLFVGSLTGIGLMYHYFSGCGTNMAFVSVTLVGCILVTAAQLSGEEGSLLSSASIVAYATFLCYTAGKPGIVRYCRQSQLLNDTPHNDSYAPLVSLFSVQESQRRVQSTSRRRRRCWYHSWRRCHCDQSSLDRLVFDR
jgi:hypothetical protein